MKAPVDNSVSKLDDHGYILAGKFRHRLADSLAIPGRTATKDHTDSYLLVTTSLASRV